jgi:hypothetical protein
MNMSRQDRLKAYSDPTRGPHGCGRDQENLDYWSDRAEANSAIAPRASDGPMRLTSTKVNTRDSSMKPFRSRNVDDAMREAKADLNDSGGGPFMRGVRRNA